MPAITHYDIGDAWTPQATFTVSGIATDPTTLTVRQQDAAGVETIIANGVNAAALTPSSQPVARVSAGVFKPNPGISLTASGYWFVRFEGTGTAAATEEHQAIVDPSEFTSDSGIGTRALVGLAETKDWLQQKNINTDNDVKLVRVINDISDRAHQESHREFKVSGTNPQTRTFELDRKALRQGIVDVGDVTSITSVQIVDSDWTTVLETVDAANYEALPLVRAAWEPIRQIRLNPFASVTAFRYGMRVKVTGTWGFPAVPGNVRQAVLDAVVETMDRDVEQYRHDLAPRSDQTGGTIIQMERPVFISMPASSLAVLWGYRDPFVY